MVFQVIKPGVLKYVKDVNVNGFLQREDEGWSVFNVGVSQYLEVLCREVEARKHKLMPDKDLASMMFALAASNGVLLRDAADAYNWMVNIRAKSETGKCIAEKIANNFGIFLWDVPLSEDQQERLWAIWGEKNGSNSKRQSVIETVVQTIQGKNDYMGASSG